MSRFTIISLFVSVLFAMAAAKPVSVSDLKKTTEHELKLQKTLKNPSNKNLDIYCADLSDDECYDYFECCMYVGATSSYCQVDEDGCCGF